MQAQGSRISKVQIQGAIRGPQMGGDLTSSGFQNNLYDNFLCFPSWTCGIFLPCYSASCHCDKLWETQYKGGQGSLGMWSEPQVSWAHYLSPRGEANTTQCWRPVPHRSPLPRGCQETETQEVVGVPVCFKGTTPMTYLLQPEPAS